MATSHVMSICTKCHAEKPIEEFGIQTASSRGRHTHCLECLRQVHRLWRAKHRRRALRPEDVPDPKVVYRELSSQGYPGYRVGGDGSVWSCRSGVWRRLAISVDKWGYCFIHLGKRNRNIPVHHLVLFAFVGTCPDGMECCHNDGDPSNNVPSNLRWDTHRSNMIDTIRHGTITHGERNGSSKLTAEKIRAIRADHATGGFTYKRLARKHGLSRSQAHRVVTKQTWAHL